MSSNGSLRNVTGGGFKFGLIKKGTAAKPVVGMGLGRGLGGSSKGSAAFGRDALEESSDEEDETEAARRAKHTAQMQAAAATNAKTQRETQKALEEDEDIFDYDKSYDAMKEAEDAKRRKRDLGQTDEHGRKKPRYVENLLAATLKRKIELERVEDRKVAREREEEGEKFGDKDAFVTEAYKERQKELRRLEDEEKRKEALQRQGGDMAQFYRSLLEEHEQMASGAALTKEEIDAAARDRERRATEKAQEEKEQLEAAVRRGEVKMNASNEIVDKRALLKSGLNISRTKVRTLNEEREADERDRRAAEDARRAKEREERERKHADFEKRRVKEEQARRLLEETEKQMREGERKRAEEIAREKEEVAAMMAKKATVEVVTDARARYLARKKAQEEAAANDSD
ncbi:hypothetical protein HDU98_000236 [Podochytrium sp. JEL0797]|nr:hypothetical protein HDU98_000236 [Podochytrium sp. JEL0797]